MDVTSSLSVRNFSEDNLTRQPGLVSSGSHKGQVKEYEFVWTRSGMILERKAEDIPLVRIDTPTDLKKFI